MPDTVRLLAEWGHNTHYILYSFDHLIETNGTGTFSHCTHVRTSHRKSLALPQKLSRRQSCWTANWRPLFRQVISQHSSCCPWHVQLSKIAKVKGSKEQGAPYRSPPLTYEWLSKLNVGIVLTPGDISEEKLIKSCRLRIKSGQVRCLHCVRTLNANSASKKVTNWFLLSS